MEREFDINSLSQLCHIKITEEEKKILQQNLEKILDYITMLHKVNTQKVEPLAHIVATMKNIMGEDNPIEKELDLDILFENASNLVGRMFKIPPVITFEP